MKSILYLFTILFILGSCEKEPESIIGKSKFIKILTEIHLADGVILTKGLKRKIKKGDSVTYYNHVFKKYNISRNKFEKTIEYYAKHTDEYKIVYDSISANLNVIDKELANNANNKNNSATKKDKNDIWNKKREWNLPKNGKKTSVPFSISVKNHGKYTLSADIRYYKNDKTRNPRLTIIAKYSDGTQDAKSNGTIVKDGKFSNYSAFIITNKKKTLKTISGWVLDHSKGTDNKHVDVKNIKLLYDKNILQK